tara:strand:- start:1546 stop:1692 length:147 start_codon:yes stop_codon:yes gene_type:complete
MKTIKEEIDELREILDQLEIRLMELLNEYELTINKKNYYMKKLKRLMI